MYIEDIILAASCVLGAFLFIIFTLGYLKERVKRFLVLALVSLILAFIGTSVLLLYSIGYWEGRAPDYLAYPIALAQLALVVYSLISYLFKRSYGK